MVRETVLVTETVEGTFWLQTQVFLIRLLNPFSIVNIYGADFLQVIGCVELVETGPASLILVRAIAFDF